MFKLNASVHRIRRGKPPGKRGGPARRLRPGRQQETGPADGPGRGQPVRPPWQVAPEFCLQMVLMFCTRGPHCAPHQGPPGSSRRWSSQRAAGRQGLVCVTRDPVDQELTAQGYTSDMQPVKASHMVYQMGWDFFFFYCKYLQVCCINSIKTTLLPDPCCVCAIGVTEALVTAYLCTFSGFY